MSDRIKTSSALDSETDNESHEVEKTMRHQSTMKTMVLFLFMNFKLAANRSEMNVTPVLKMSVLGVTSRK